MAEKEPPMLITAKEVVIEISKEQAIRTGIADQLFRDRQDVDYNFELTNIEPIKKEKIPSDMERLKITLTNLHITSK